jgi:hypothetical protein
MSACSIWTCENEVLETKYSPDGSFKLVIFQRQCGATTGFNRQALLLRRDQFLRPKAEATGFFCIRGEPRIEVAWLGTNSVRIRYEFGYAVMRTNNPDGPVKVTYEEFVAK